MYKATLVHHEERINLGLSLIEYCMCDIIYHMSNVPDSGGRCEVNRESIANFLDITRRGVQKIINRLVEMKLVEVDKKKKLRTTMLRYCSIIVKSDCEQNSQQCEQSSHPEKEESNTGLKPGSGREQSSQRYILLYIYRLDIFISSKVKNKYILYIKDRFDKKDKVTEEAINIGVKRLNKYGKTEEEQIEIIENSIHNGRKGLFPLKNTNGKKDNKPANFLKPQNYEEGVTFEEFIPKEEQHAG